MTGTHRVRNSGWCYRCDKLWYQSRSDAKAKARLHPSHKVAYRCPWFEHLWHFGELHPAVIAGNTSRHNYYWKDRLEALSVTGDGGGEREAGTPAAPDSGEPEPSADAA